MANTDDCRTAWAFYGTALLALLPLVQPAAQGRPFDSRTLAQGRPTLVRAARLLDPSTGRVQSPVAILVADGRIKDVGSPARVGADSPADVDIVDLGSATVLPGLIDAHTHLLLDVVVPPEAELERHDNGRFAPGLLLAIAESPGKRVLLGAQLAREDLESGITTVRNLGHSGVDGDTELRDAINAGRIVGPRILASGRKLIARGSYVKSLNPALAAAILDQEFLLVDGIDQARQAVRQNVFQNVDVIKVTVGEDISVAELSAVVDEAHRQHLKVAVHAIDAASIQTAIDAGSDSIEHGNQITDEQLQQLRARGMFFDLTPTSYGGLFLKIMEPRLVVSPTFVAATASADQRARTQYDALVRRVLKSGVKFSAGSDMCWSYPGRTRGQASVGVFVNLREAGLPALDVIRAVTTNAAAMLGWADRIGAIETGKLADLIAVAGDPMADIHELERVHFVMKAGRVVRNDFQTRRTEWR